MGFFAVSRIIFKAKFIFIYNTLFPNKRSRENVKVNLIAEKE